MLYPLFVHIYLDLIVKGHDAAGKSSVVEHHDHTYFYLLAAEFMKEFKNDHIDTNQDEVSRLQAIYSAETIGDNEVAQLFMNNKFILHMSAQSFELLLAFLQDQKITNILNILNQYIQLNVYTRYPKGYIESSNNNSENSLWGIIDEKKTFGSPDGVLSTSVSDDEDDQDSRKRRRDTKKKAKTPKRKKKDDSEDNQDINIAISPVFDNTELEDFNSLREKLNSNYQSLPSIKFYAVDNPSCNLNVCVSSYDHSLFACGYGDSTIKLWDTVGSNRMQYISKLEDYDFFDRRDQKGLMKMSREHYFELVGHTQPVFGLNFSKDCRYLLSSSSDSTVRLWCMDKKEAITCYRGHSFPVWNTAFSPLGHYFASASCDKTARLWSTDSLHPQRVFSGHLGDVNTVEFHPNSNYLLTGSSDKTIRFWEVHTGECVRIFTSHLSSVHCLAASPDGRFALSGGEDRDVIIWDLNAGKPVNVFKGHEAVVWSVDISQDGNYIATGSGDRTVRLWDLRKMSPDESVDKSSSSPLLSTYSTSTYDAQVLNVCFGTNNVLLASGPRRTNRS